MAKVELGKAVNTKELLKRSVEAARPKKSNMTAYAAIAIAGGLGLYFFSGPKVPEPDRSGLIESEGVVTQALPASVTGETEDMLTETVDPAPESAVPADGMSAEMATSAEGQMPAAVEATQTAPLVPVPALPAAPEVPTTAVASNPPPANNLAGTSAAGATLPAMFAGGAPAAPAAGQALMVPAEVAAVTSEAPKVEEKPTEVSLQERADRGDADAMYQLGMSAVSNEDSDGLKKRFRYLQAAATRGSVPAMREVAGLHERGEGVLASERMAYVWATLASAFGEDMTSFRDRLAAKMSEDELESGQRAAAATLKGFGTAAMEKAKSYKTAMKP